ncbi:MAG: TRAP transporter substrate-binding protein DctP [Firmicutes bacterium]|nr:TRAP transporter substrate-binding protein DctP [Bacillota bacterium]
MKKKGLVLAVLTIFLVGLFVLSGCGGKGTETGREETAEPGGEDKVYTFNLASETPEGHPISVNFLDSWVDRIEKATNGRVKFNKHYAGSLVEGGSMLQGVSSGIADCGWCPLSYFPGEFPLYNALCVTGYDWISGRLAAYVNRDFIEAFPQEIPDELEFMWVHSPAPGCLLTTKPVSTLEDLKGLQFRCDSVHNDGLAALGATPVAMTMPEAYEALSKNIIDGVLGNTEPLIGWSLYEITDYIVEVPCLYSTPPVLIFNKKSWNSLPPDLQETIRKVNEEHFEAISTVFDDIYVEGMKFGLENGLKTIQLTDDEYERWIEKLQVCKEKYAEDLNKKGLPGDEAIQKLEELVQKYLVEFEDYHKEWRGRIEAVIAEYQ